MLAELPQGLGHPMARDIIRRGEEDTGIVGSRRATRLLSLRLAIRMARSIPSETRSTRLSVMMRSTFTAGLSRRKAGTIGATILRPKATDVVTRSRPNAPSVTGRTLA